MIWEASDRPAAFAGTVQVEPEGSAAQTPAPEAIDVETGESAPATTESTTSTTADSSVEELLELLDSSPASTATAMPLQPLAEKPARLPDHKPADTTPVQAVHQGDADPSGAHFLAWLRQSIQTRKLIINDAKALVHTVADTAYLVSPGVFQRYAQEHPQITALAKQDKLPEWQWVQKRFEKLGLHRKQASGLNIWNCEVTGPRKSRRLHGYLLTSPDTLFHEIPPNNPYLRLANAEAQRDDSAFHAKNDDEQE